MGKVKNEMHDGLDYRFNEIRRSVCTSTRLKVTQLEKANFVKENELKFTQI